MKKYEWLLFDLDNTILDFDKGSKVSFQSLLKELGIKEEPHFYGLYQAINKHIWWEFNRNMISQDEVRIKRFYLFFQTLGIEFDSSLANQIYFKYLGQQVEFIDGALELLKNLKKDFKICMVTNGMKEVQRSRIALAGLESWFDHFVISDEIGVAKPDPAFFDQVRTIISYDNITSMLMIGDTPQSDIIGANNYGIDSCWYNPKLDPMIDGIEATYNIKDLNEIYEILGVTPG